MVLLELIIRRCVINDCLCSLLSFDSFGGDDTAVLGLYSTEEKAFEAGRKREKEAQERWEKNKSISYRKKPSFDGFFVHGYGDYYVKIMEVDKETI